MIIAFSTTSKYHSMYFHIRINPCTEHTDCQELQELGLACTLNRLGARKIGTKQVGNSECTMWVFAEGRTVKTHCDSNFQIMSDVWGIGNYATFVDNNNQVITILTGHSEDGSEAYYEAFSQEILQLSLNGLESKVDATDEVKAIYLQHCEKKALESEKKAQEKAALQEKWEKAKEKARQERPEVGFEVEVYKGRKFPIGLRGVVFWMGTNRYGEVCGVKDSKGEVYWISADNVKKVVPSHPLPELKGTDKQIRWATSIRAEFAKENPNHQRLHDWTFAKVWIENRDRL